jgi:hypothetical protein
MNWRRNKGTFFEFRDAEQRAKGLYFCGDMLQEGKIKLWGRDFGRVVAHGCCVVLYQRKIQMKGGYETTRVMRWRVIAENWNIFVESMGGRWNGGQREEGERERYITHVRAKENSWVKNNNKIHNQIIFKENK